jgi:uncharacterized protein YneF (UPF0154 family)
MLNFVLTYLTGYLMGMFITRHVFLKIIKNVYDYNYKIATQDIIDLLKNKGHDMSANIINISAERNIENWKNL